MPISTAIFIGFVLNELVTNSMKYAIQMDQKLKIGVKFTEIENHLTIEYWDNGKGLLAENTEFENGGFGFKLMQIMMKQLKSTLYYSIEKGNPTFKFTISKA
jgi:two-component sensor histidine kinase